MKKIETITIRDEEIAKEFCQILKKFNLFTEYQDTGCSDSKGAYIDIFISNKKITKEDMEEE